MITGAMNTIMFFVKENRIKTIAKTKTIIDFAYNQVKCIQKQTV